MQILLWYWGRRGGGAQFALSLAEALQPEVALSVATQGALIEEFRRLAVPRQEVSTYQGVAGFAAGFARLPALGAALRGFAAETGADVVLSAMSHPWTPFLAPGLARAGIPFVPVIHDAAPHPGDRQPLFFWRLDRELAAARAAVVLSEPVARLVAARRPGLPLVRLPLGAHLPPASVTPASEPTDLLFFGRFRAYKGLDLLRDAWPILRAAHPAATLRVVGEGDAEACAPGLSALPGVRVEPRWVADGEMAALIASARVLVLPYREASQSGVLPLALALGVPVVATAVGGLSEQMAEGGGVLVPPEPAALAAGMAGLLEPARHAAAAAEAREAGRLLADWGALAGKLRAGLGRALG
jgi:glycosyltransferase involved in cell wall biosynthesis